MALLSLTSGSRLMSLLEPLTMQMTVLSTISSFLTSSPAIPRAPAGYKMIASSSYISSIVFAINPSWIRFISNFSSFRIYFISSEVRMVWDLSSSLKLRQQKFICSPNLQAFLLSMISKELENRKVQNLSDLFQEPFAWNNFQDLMQVLLLLHM